MKFSGSPRIWGLREISIISNVKTNDGARRSLQEKNGAKGSFSLSLDKPRGFDDPFVCREAIWIIAIPANINGITKWRERNRLSVAFLTENPPHNHSTKVVPTSGIADARFVITVAPQNDICPHGNTYPRKAVPIKINNMIVPVIQVSFFLYDLFNNPREI